MAKQEPLRQWLRRARPATVTVRLPLEKGKPEQLLVSVNAKRYSIQRGKTVEIPWAVAQVIEQSEASDRALALRLRALAEHPPVAVL